jgi:hypothetical protein
MRTSRRRCVSGGSTSSASTTTAVSTSSWSSCRAARSNTRIEQRTTVTHFDSIRQALLSGNGPRPLYPYACKSRFDFLFHFRVGYFPTFWKLWFTWTTLCLDYHRSFTFSWTLTACNLHLDFTSSFSAFPILTYPQIFCTLSQFPFIHHSCILTSFLHFLLDYSHSTGCISTRKRTFQQVFFYSDSMKRKMVASR